MCKADVLIAMNKQKRTVTEQSDFDWMLSMVNLVYLGASVLILLNKDYMERFWTSVEAWLSMQVAMPEGLRSGVA